MSEVTIRDYLKRRIIFSFREFGKMPTIEWLYNNINKKELKNNLPVRVSYNKLNSELSYLISDGFILLEKDIFILNPNKNFISDSYQSDKLLKTEKDTKLKQVSKPQKKESDIIIDYTEPEKEPENNQKINKDWYNIINQIVLLFIGAGSAYMSIYYSHIWLLDFLDTYRALLLAVIMVCFAIAAFELIIFFKRDKKYSLVFVFSFLWVIVTFFSMISTIAGQYNARMDALTKRYAIESDAIIATKKQSDYQEQKQEYKDTLAMLKKKNDHFQSLLFQYNTPEKITEDKKMYNSLSYNSQLTSNKINSVITKMDDLDYKKGTNNIIKKVPLDFYVWISNLTGITPEMVQFWLSIFPAIFIDLMAPFSFAIVLYARQVT